MSRRIGIKKEDPITDPFDALARLCVEGWRTSAKVVGGKDPYIKQSHDCGYYFSTAIYYITKEVYEELKSKDWIRGKPMIGYVSDHEFEVTAFGEEYYYTAKEEREAVKNLIGDDGEFI